MKKIKTALKVRASKQLQLEVEKELLINDKESQEEKDINGNAESGTRTEDGKCDK